MLKNKEFISRESLAGGLLVICALLALFASNSGLASLYHHFFDIIFSVKFNDTGLAKPIVLWINDGLMAIFFLLVGLELKREIISGELKEYDKALLPISGAVGGMLIPALIYYFITKEDASITVGWAIPMATDIAFALGILALFGKRVPLSLKVFLMSLAIIDDLGAIVVIALFHTANLSWEAFFLGSLCLAALIIMNKFKIATLSMYLVVGAIMWLCVLKSGFHATMAGILLAFTIPMQAKDNKPMLENLEHDLHSLVTFFILPLFAFANAGVPLHGISFTSLQHPLIVAIILGLFLGKISGIFVFTTLAKIIFRVKSSFNNWHLLGISSLCGIGFTMSLFIAGLSFGQTETLLNYSRLGILLASLISMTAGIIILFFALPKR